MSRHDQWAAYLDPESPTAPDAGADREALDRVRSVLADPLTWDQPPTGLTARVLELAAAEPDRPPADGAGPASPAGPVRAVDEGGDAVAARPGDPAPAGTGAGPEPADAAVPSPAPGAGGTADVARLPEHDRASAGPTRFGSRRTRWVVAVTGIAAAIAAGLTVLLWPDRQLATYPLAGTAAEPAASAVVTLDPRPAGLAITVAITGLPPSTSDTYYAAWLRGGGGTVGIGSFHWRKGSEPIDLWSGVDAGRYPTFFITRQREGDPPAPSAQVVLAGRVGG